MRSKSTSSTRASGRAANAIGYGPERPIADNKTKAGKAKNRRTEFKLVTGN